MLRNTLLLTAAALLFAGPALALPQINGSISLNGQDTYTSSTVTFNGAGNVGPGTATGSFTPAFDPGCAGCVTLTSFGYNPFTGPVTLYSATIGGSTTTLDLTSITSFSLSPTGSFLDIEGTGTATLTGFADTPGSLTFSSQGGEARRVTFSTTTDVVATPEPGSLLLLGVGLVGVGLARRRSSFCLSSKL